MSSKASAREKCFRDILKEKSPNLADCLERMEEIAIQTWASCLPEDHGSLCGFPHFRNVEKNADKMVPTSEKELFSEGELFLLLAAILLHDIGKINPYKKLKSGKAQFVGHFMAGYGLIKSHWQILGLPNEHLANYCALLAFSHGSPNPPATEKKDPEKLDKGFILMGDPDFRNTSLHPYGQLRIRPLAAILRIADEAENHWTRALPGIWRDIAQMSPETAGKAYRECVEDMEFNGDGRCLIVHVGGASINIEKIGNDQKTTLAVIKNWADELRHLQVIIDNVFVKIGDVFYSDLSSQHLKKPRIAELFHQDEDKNRVENLTNALTQLCMGSLNFTRFSFDAISRAMGREFTNFDVFLLDRLASQSKRFQRLELDREKRLVTVRLNNTAK